MQDLISKKLNQEALNDLREEKLAELMKIHYIQTIFDESDPADGDARPASATADRGAGRP